MANRISKGCFEISGNTLHKLDNLEYTTCVGNHVSESVIFWIEAEGRYNQGVLPFPGSMVDQPAKVMDVFSCIATYKQSKLNKQRKAQQLKDRAIGRRKNKSSS